MLQNTEIGSSRQLSLRQETFIRCFGKSCSSKPHQREKKNSKNTNLLHQNIITTTKLHSACNICFCSAPTLIFFLTPKPNDLSSYMFHFIHSKKYSSHLQWKIWHELKTWPSQGKCISQKYSNKWVKCRLGR